MSTSCLLRVARSCLGNLVADQQSITPQKIQNRILKSLIALTSQKNINKYNKKMTENAIQSYLDNDHPPFSTHARLNELAVSIEDPLKGHFRVEIKVYCWAKISEVMEQIGQRAQFGDLRGTDFRLFHKNMELSDLRKTLLDYNISNSSLLIIQRRNKFQPGSKGTINPYKLFERANPKVATLIEESRQAVNLGVVPTLTSQGTSGVYLIQDLSGRRVSIFKPFDEEVNAPNNPRNRRGKLGSEGISKGILSGQCATRQVAAYLLDNESHSFHSVPTTTYIEFHHPTFTHSQPISTTPIPSPQEQTLPPTLNNALTKHGSLQQFVHSDGLVGDYGAKRFRDTEVRKIGILDVRILNCDRNQENVLVREGEGKDGLTLVPIDHGLSFPDNLEIYEESLLWMSYPQSKKPFTEEQLKFIQEINPLKDAEMLESKLGFRQICLRNFRIAQIFLKKAAAIGFTLYQIGKFLYRSQDHSQTPTGSPNNNDEKTKSKRSSIETLVMQAENLYLNAIETMEKQNIQPQQNDSNRNEDEGEELEDILDQVFDSGSQGEGLDGIEEKSSGNNSSSTCGSIKSMLQLRKKVSLPQLKKKDTSFHELRSKARKEREGINGISKTIWHKYYQEEWNQLFYYYFGNLLDTFLLEKSMAKSRKLNQRTESAK